MLMKMFLKVGFNKLGSADQSFIMPLHTLLCHNNNGGGITELRSTRPTRHLENLTLTVLPPTALKQRNNSVNIDIS